MGPLLKRIAVNGSVAVLILGLIGFGLAELAGMWLVTQAPTRAVPVAADAPPAVDPMAAALRGRIPFVIAGWGLLFVVVGEVLFYLVRGNPQAKAAKKAKELKPDTAEVLLEQLLREVEAKQATPSGQAHG